MANSSIPVHKDELRNELFQIHPISALEKFAEKSHRDDYYVFVIQKNGRFIFEIDFVEIELKGPSAGFVLPGQVHNYLNHQSCDGLIIFISPELVPRQCLDIFDIYYNIRSIELENNDSVFKLISVLEETLIKKGNPGHVALTNSLLASFVQLISAKIIEASESLVHINNRKYNHFINFKTLVKERLIERKQVKQYASSLNISAVYLNQLCKQLTGFSASHWINQEVLMEAKRLLYYTELDVKQVGFKLGFDDYAYFSRFFKKHVGETATEFRFKNCALSNHRYEKDYNQKITPINFA
ncbi:AraC family transcriptional activator of pobA [Pedobacter sp. UYP30]|uniref:helix-turn-helix domain-containing protein n=1 Tax=Pedobacter sp. UYP30 TaxID=1756400 RepID=UPI00339705C5